MKIPNDIKVYTNLYTYIDNVYFFVYNIENKIFLGGSNKCLMYLMINFHKLCQLLQSI